MIRQQLGDELSTYKMILTGDKQINKFGCKTGPMLIRRIDFNKKSLPLFKAKCLKKKYRKDLSLTLYSKRYFSDAFTVNVNSQEIQDKERKIKLTSTLDPEYDKNKFIISSQIADMETLLKAFNLLKKKQGNITEEKLQQISSDIMEGKYVFKPLASYKIPKKSVKLNKAMVQKHIKNITLKEKIKFFKDIKNEKKNTRAVTEYRLIFEELFESKIVAKAIQLVLHKIIKEKNYFPFNMFAYQDNTSSIDVVDYIKTKVSKSSLTFMIQADLKNFFP